MLINISKMIYDIKSRYCCSFLVQSIALMNWQDRYCSWTKRGGDGYVGGDNTGFDIGSGPMSD